MTAPGLHVRIAEHGRARVVHVAGEIDILTAPGLVAALPRDGDFDGLVVDLDKVKFVSSTGLGLIMTLHRRLSRGGGRLVVSGAHDNVARVLELTGLAEVVLVAADVESALELLKSGHARRAEAQGSGSSPSSSSTSSEFSA